MSKSEIKSALQELQGWNYEADGLTKIFKFGSFREAISFLIRAAFEAEEMNHHPDWTNVYDKLIIRLTTHDAGGKVTAKDVELAKRIQRISWVG